MTEESSFVKSDHVDLEFNERLETLKKYANTEIQKCDELLREQEKQIEEHKKLRNKISGFPKFLRRDDWLPINDYAFIRGTYNNTNKFHIHLGCKYFADKSAAQTVEFIDRKIKAINEIKEGYQKHRELAKSKLEFAESLFEQQNSDIVEIREPFDEEIVKVKKETKEEVSDQDFEAIMARLDDLEKEEEGVNEGDTEKNQAEVVEIQAKQNDDVPVETAIPKGLSQEEFNRFIKCVDKMMETSDEEDYEEGADTDALDSDDSLPENEKVNTAVTPPSVTKPPLKTDKANLSQKRGVRFSAQLEAGPTTGGADTEHPKPILRNKDEKTPVDEKAIQAMEETEPKRSILPATDAFNGVFVERNPYVAEPIASPPLNPDAKKPVSKFKAQRMKHQ